MLLSKLSIERFAPTGPSETFVHTLEPALPRETVALKVHQVIVHESRRIPESRGRIRDVARLRVREILNFFFCPAIFSLRRRRVSQRVSDRVNNTRVALKRARTDELA